jgi:hypothetical protein
MLTRGSISLNRPTAPVTMAMQRRRLEPSTGSSSLRIQSKPIQWVISPATRTSVGPI